MNTPLPPHALKKLLSVGSSLVREGDASAVELGKYRTLREIGRGGMGIVYEALDATLQRKVALKVLTDSAGSSEDARQRFVREAQAAARLSHPNIAAIFDATGEYIAMQLIEGPTLAEIEWTDHRLLAGLVRDAALAVHAAHQHGIVHRDLKPANLMVEGFEQGGTPHIYVMDFGLAKETALDSSLSTSGSILGTPSYMAPEQAAGRLREVDERSDVYALGATLYDRIAGRPPFAGEDVYQLIMSTVEGEPEPLERIGGNVDRELATIAMKCLAKEPERRYSSALALASDLDLWLRGEPIAARPPSATYRLKKYMSRKRSVLKVSSIVALAVAAIASMILVPREMRALAGRESATKALTLASQVSQVLIDAKTYASAGDLPSAREQLDLGISACRAFLAETDVGDVHYFLGRLLCARKQNGEALAELDLAIESSPQLKAARLLRGLLHAERVSDMGAQGKSGPEVQDLRSAALADLDHALGEARGSQSAERLYACGQRAWLRGDELEAERFFKDAIALDPFHAQSYLCLSRLFLERGEEDLARFYATAFTDLLSGLRRTTLPSNSTGNVQPNACYNPEGLEGLCTDFASVGSFAPGDALSLCYRAQTNVRLAGRRAAVKEYEQALEALDQAILDYDSAIRLDPKRSEAFNARALCHYERDKRLTDAGNATEASNARNAAIKDLQEALRLAPDLAPAWFNRGLLHKRMGMLLYLSQRPFEAELLWENAKSNLRRALERMPRASLERAHIESALEQVSMLLDA